MKYAMIVLLAVTLLSLALYGFLGYSWWKPAEFPGDETRVAIIWLFHFAGLIVPAAYWGAQSNG